jgi:cyanophycin synthetase
VLNADDATLVARAAAVRAPITWFTLDRGNSVVAGHLSNGGSAAFVDSGTLVLAHGRRRAIEVPVGDVPITLGGAAVHNVANALGAMALGAGLGLPPEAIVAGLTGLRGTAADNPGRMNVYMIGGVQAIVDYAHNPHGIAALMAAVAALAPARTLLVVGQPGNRDDAGIRAAARAAWAAAPDMIVVKELDRHLRGRAAGEVSAMLRDELREAGAPADRVTAVDDEIDAIAWALAWARPGDVLALTVHGHRDRALELLERLAATGWQPGDPVQLPAATPDPAG